MEDSWARPLEVSKTSTCKSPSSAFNMIDPQYCMYCIGMQLLHVIIMLMLSICEWSESLTNTNDKSTHQGRAL